MATVMDRGPRAEQGVALAGTGWFGGQRARWGHSRRCWSMRFNLPPSLITAAYCGSKALGHYKTIAEIAADAAGRSPFARAGSNSASISHSMGRQAVQQVLADAPGRCRKSPP